MNHKIRLTIVSFLLIIVAAAQTNTSSFSQPPFWSKNAIWYQIFVERFFNGDRNNDPTPETVNTPFLKQFVPNDWAVTPWTSNWYQLDSWASKAGIDRKSVV